MPKAELSMTPIGHIHISKGQTRLELDEAYTPALQGLEGFSHILVLFWCHLTATDAHRHRLTNKKPYTKGPDKIGTFATRSPGRPNPIGLTPVQIITLDMDLGVIEVTFIDAEDGTPIIDIKPYHPSLDRIREVGVPQWCRHWPQWHEDSAAFDWAAEFNFT
jgi:tRNA-Thr(GGU) m(6)t(6)A37 methyltransferase TsaA